MYAFMHYKCVRMYVCLYACVGVCECVCGAYVTIVHANVLSM